MTGCGVTADSHEVFQAHDGCLLLFTGVKLTLSALVDGKSINAGCHKLGLALELEALIQLKETSGNGYQKTWP